VKRCLLTPADHEIFRLRDDVIASEGANATFYSFVGVGRKATMEQINRAYRRMTAKIHPDKARKSFIEDYKKNHGGRSPSGQAVEAFHKRATDRTQRLSLIANLLRDDRRDRYDWFLDHGFPTWRGTDYYFERYRPGAGTVLVGLFLFMGGLAHYGALILSWQRQRQFVEKHIKHARKLAYGNSTVIPGLDTVAPVAGNGNGSNGSAAVLNRKQKRAQDKELKKNPKKGIAPEDVGAPEDPQIISGPVGTKRRVTAENGNQLIVDSVGNVYLEETTEEGETHEYLIDVRLLYEWLDSLTLSDQRNTEADVVRHGSGEDPGLVLEEDRRTTHR
jgi:curved DNA-binding protein CbpA